MTSSSSQQKSSKPHMHDPTTPPKKGRADSSAPYRTRQRSDTTEVQRELFEPHTFDETSIGIGAADVPTSFSPSKARAQAHASYQITVLKNWLQDLFDEHEAGSDNNVELHKDSAGQSYSATETGTRITATKSAKYSGRQHSLISRWENEYMALQTQRPTPESTSYTLASRDVDSSLPRQEVSGAEVLKALQDLMFINQSADEHRKILHAARVEELSRLEKRPQPTNDVASTSNSKTKQDEVQSQIDETTQPANEAAKLLRDFDHAVSSNIKVETALESLSETARILGVNLHNTPSLFPSSSSPSDQETLLIEDLFTALQIQTSSSLDLVTNITSLQSQISILERKLSSAQSDLKSLRNTMARSEGEAEKMQAQTSQWVRESKQIMLKIQEYQDRIAVLSRTRPGFAKLDDGGQVVLLEDVLEMQDRVERRADVVRQLEDRVKVFHGLPPDLEASREEVRRAKNELEDLKRRREELFQNVVG